jgi:hypothetical protein
MNSGQEYLLARMYRLEYLVDLLRSRGGGGGGTSITGTGLWHNIAGVLQAAALIGSPGQFVVANTTPDAAFVTISGDVSASAVTPGKLTVTGLRGVSVPAPTGVNTILQYNGTTFSWNAPAAGTSVTGTGLWHNVSGNLQAAALDGTAGQFVVANTTPDAAFVTITGDVTASVVTPGDLTVVGIQTVAVPAPSGANTVLQFNAGAFTWAPGAFTTVTGTGVWHNIGGALQPAALVGTAGQFFVTNTTPDTAFVTISGDVTASTVTPGLLTVVALRGVSVPAPSGSNTVLQFNAGAFTWAPEPGAVSVTGTGVWHSIGGALQPAALVGTAGQFFVTNTTPDTAFVTISGDATASVVTPGKLTVVGIQSIAVPTPSGSDTVLQFNAGAFTWATVSGGAFTPGSDIAGNGTSTSTNQYVSALSFSSAAAGGTIPVNGTNTLLNWVTNGITLQQGGTTLLQLKAAATDFIRFGAAPGASGFLRAPTNSIIIGVNGNSVLQTDAGPATYLGAVTQILLQIGGATQANLTTASLTLLPANFLFSQTSGSANITFATAGVGVGSSLTVAAQAGAAGTNAGGGLILQTGAGTGGALSGTMQFFIGNTDEMILTAASLSIVPPIVQFVAGGVQFFVGVANHVASWTTTLFSLDVPIGGDAAANLPFEFATQVGALSVAGATLVLSAAQYANVLIPLTGNLPASGTCTVTVPNVVGATWLFDITAVVSSASTLVFTTGSGTSFTFGPAAFVASKKLITVAVSSSNVVTGG